MPLIGTAGHVDHGKSTLVQSLTGRDPDRLAEEKERGLTIDLGFAWSTLPDGTEVSFVDVPGHERYLKNMLAGVEAIDVALLVVAADEGWMPQSEEHLAVLDLLGIDSGVVAITKTDIAGEEMAELVSLEVADRLAGSSLEGARLIGVSAISGNGIDELANHLAVLVAQVEAEDVGRPRLWVDRSFTVSGAGTVVTGTLLGGRIREGDTLEVLPQRREVRVRAIQSHEKSLSEARPGSRVAVNLSGIDRSDISRGDMIGLPGQWHLSDRWLVALSKARYSEPIEQKGAYQMHLGTSAHPIRLTALQDPYAVVSLEAPLPAGVGDRFILRDTGRSLVVAGGRVIDPNPAASLGSIASAGTIDPDATPEEIAGALLSLRGIDDADRLAAHSRGGVPANAVRAGDLIASPQFVDRAKGEAVRLVEREHGERPLREGILLATLAERLGLGMELTELIVDEEPGLERMGPAVRSAGREISLDDDALSAWSSAVSLLRAGLDVPGVDALGLDQELLHVLIRDGKLVRISENLVYLPDQVEEIVGVLGGLGEAFTVAEFRDAADLSRKYAIPILEWTDSQGITARQGDVRRLK